jgi:hypothetical protein
VVQSEEPEIRLAICAEIERALQHLGAGSVLASVACRYSTPAIVEVITKLGAKSDLLEIVGSYRKTEDQWVLDQLKQWNENN